MGAESDGTEFDAGHALSDADAGFQRNQIVLTYLGADTAWGNSSLRIATIQDITGTYNFGYTSNHWLNSIAHSSSALLVVHLY
jgi:hypothetical protein